MKSIVLFLFLGFSLIACSKSEEDLSCFSFDIRQCQTDLFADDVPVSDSKEEREDKMRDWLESNGYDVKNIKLVINFQEAVCEACHVCPQGDRYFVQKKNSSNEITSDSLQLLNFEVFDCEDEF